MTCYARKRKEKTEGSELGCFVWKGLLRQFLRDFFWSRELGEGRTQACFGFWGRGGTDVCAIFLRGRGWTGEFLIEGSELQKGTRQVKGPARQGSEYFFLAETPWTVGRNGERGDSATTWA
ncbi:hypothetical protein TRVL_09493 [Trypanosoma vivax]|nr:hypothetical protein TRVL_09493 [Trypanosoma vivax]